jgi:hypothetical protein
VSATAVTEDELRVTLAPHPADAIIAFSLLTLFYSAFGLALRAVLRTFTSRREDVANQRK